LTAPGGPFTGPERLVLTDGNGFTMNLAEVPQGGRR